MSGKTSSNSEETSKNVKSHAIIDAACNIFLKQGFSCANMDKIAQKANVSKQTIYSNFGSKDNLFNEVITHLFKGMKEIFTQEEAQLNPKDSFVNYIISMLTPLFSKEGINLHRLALSEGPQNENLHKIYISRLERGISKLAARISLLEMQGIIKVDDSTEAAHDLIYACKGITHTKLLIGYTKSLTPEEISHIAHKHSDKFFKTYKVN